MKPDRFNYDVYFEMYGKKMKAVILAENEEQAKQLVKDKIVFHKIVKSKDEFNEAMDIFEDIISFLDKQN